MSVKVLFVCMGNICRSPTAEAIFTKYVQDHQLEHLIEIDSAGTHHYHIGCAPDERAQAMAQKYGYEMSHLRARQVSENDFHQFDYIIAMDQENVSGLTECAPNALDHKISLLLEHTDHATETVVPDPYYGGEENFEMVIELVEKGAKGLLEKIKKDLERC